MKTRLNPVQWAGTVMAATLAACGGPTALDQTFQPSLAVGPASSAGGVTQGAVQICKEGSDATIAVAINGGTATSYAVAKGTCQTVHTITGATTVTATELPTANTVLDSILAIRGTAETQGGPLTVDTIRVTGSASASRGPVFGESGLTFVFFNTFTPPPPPPPPPGGQGCTPGYWKQSQHFDSWVGYAPTDKFESIFQRDVPGNPTLLDALGANGGGIYALERHTVAALLNTTSINYGMTAAGVITAFRAAFDAGDYETQKNKFAALNELGCPLN